MLTGNPWNQDVVMLSDGVEINWPKYVKKSVRVFSLILQPIKRYSLYNKRKVWVAQKQNYFTTTESNSQNSFRKFKTLEMETKFNMQITWLVKKVRWFVAWHKRWWEMFQGESCPCFRYFRRLRAGSLINPEQWDCDKMRKIQEREKWNHNNADRAEWKGGKKRPKKSPILTIKSLNNSFQ